MKIIEADLGAIALAFVRGPGEDLDDVIVKGTRLLRAPPIFSRIRQYKFIVSEPTGQDTPLNMRERILPVPLGCDEIIAAAKKTASNRSMLPPPKASINEARTLMLFALLIRAGPCRRQRQPCLSDSEVMAVARVLAEVLHNNIPRP